MIGRRSFITGLVSLIAAPAIVRVGSLMPVKSFIEVVVDPTMLAAEKALIDDVFLGSLFAILAEHPDLNCTQVVEMLNERGLIGAAAR